MMLLRKSETFAFLSSGESISIRATLAAQGSRPVPPWWLTAEGRTGTGHLVGIRNGATASASTRSWCLADSISEGTNLSGTLLLKNLSLRWTLSSCKQKVRMSANSNKGLETCWTPNFLCGESDLGAPEEFRGLQTEQQILLQSKKVLEYTVSQSWPEVSYELLWLLIMLELEGSVEYWWWDLPLFVLFKKYLFLFHCTGS